MSGRAAPGSSIVEVLDRVLDKGIVIDASVRLSVAGVELLTVDARVIVASFQTYLRHADTISYTRLASPPPKPGIDAAQPPLLEEPGRDRDGGPPPGVPLPS